jgi:hypothetical protein
MYCDIDLPSKVQFIYCRSADALGKCHFNCSRETSWSGLLVSKLKLTAKQMQATVICSAHNRSTNWLLYLKILVKDYIYIIVLSKPLLYFPIILIVSAQSP